MDSLRANGIDIEYVNIDRKISHSQIFYLFDISDVYLMLHRVSIFDFSTLEAMANGKAVILSDIYGNREFDVDENILLINEKTPVERIKCYVDQKEKFGKKNKDIYEKYFGKTAFEKMYADFLNHFIDKVENNV